MRKNKVEFLIAICAVLIVFGMVVAVYIDFGTCFKGDADIQNRLAEIEKSTAQIYLALPSTPEGFKSMYREVLMDLQSEKARLVKEQKRRKK